MRYTERRRQQKQQQQQKEVEKFVVSDEFASRPSIAVEDAVVWPLHRSFFHPDQMDRCGHGVRSRGHREPFFSVYAHPLLDLRLLRRMKRMKSAFCGKALRLNSSHNKAVNSHLIATLTGSRNMDGVDRGVLLSAWKTYYETVQRSFRPKDNGISTSLHSTLTHLHNNTTYARMLFINFNSTFNTLIPSNLFNKLSELTISSSLCYSILDFLTNRTQPVSCMPVRGSSSIINFT
ncbi:uncharacterized protein [Chaetodon trifascialis]|uniref:uncharacterized protein n=1 Tax=Chaetodon trifascialis TaxID=109706 RepID=UPI003991F99C